MTDVGDVVATLLTVRDRNGVLTNATVAHSITHPDGSVTAGSPVNDSTGKYHADIAIDAAGPWKWKFTVTGAATDTVYGSLYASAVWTTPPPYVPPLREIADYVPTRTVPVDVPGSMTPLGTFSSTTVPNDEAVDRLAQAAASWVTARAGVVDATLYDLARATAAVRAAAFVELAYPTRDGDAEVYAALFEQAAAMLEELKTANGSAGGTPPGEGLLPVGSFPDPLIDLDVWGPFL